MAYRAEYLWIDGTEPTAEIRSKTKILADGAEPGIWGFDGSSTNQASGDNSDVVLQPVLTCPDPIRGGRDIIVMCETWGSDGKPNAYNFRHDADLLFKEHAAHEFWFGLEFEPRLDPPHFVLPDPVVPPLRFGQFLLEAGFHLVHRNPVRQADVLRLGEQHPRGHLAVRGPRRLVVSSQHPAHADAAMVLQLD